jgi:hypothetical protein
MYLVNRGKSVQVAMATTHNRLPIVAYFAAHLG